MQYQKFIVDVEEKIAIITLNNPPANSISTVAVSELNSILQEFEKNNDIRVLIITGKDREDKPEKSIFCAGADITEFGELFSKGKAFEIVQRGQSLFLRIENFPKPVIACINGHALGGGCEMAIACHLRVMADTATMGTPEIKLGILPAYGGTTRLPRLIPKTKALEILLTGDMIPAEECLRIGLVNKVVRKGEELKTAKDLAKKLCILSAPIAMKEIINIVSKCWEISPEESYKMEKEAFDMLSKTKDASEGITAFLQKRAPDFKNE